MAERHHVTSVRLYRMLQRQCAGLSMLATSSASALSSHPPSSPATPPSSMVDGHKHILATSDDEEKKDMFLLQPTLKAPDWGRHSKFRSSSSSSSSSSKSPSKNTLFKFFHMWLDQEDKGSMLIPIDDWLYEVLDETETAEDGNGVVTVSDDPTHWIPVSNIRDAIRYAFRHQYKSISDIKALHTIAIRAYQVLLHQELLWRQTSVAHTGNVQVVATSLCIGTSSSPRNADMTEPKYRFAYRIRIENRSEQYVQLLGRYWHIQEMDDGEHAPYDRDPIVVAAPTTGAVGQLPVLAPGESFEYMSGTDMATGIGMMKGTFFMARVDENTPSAKSGDVVEALKSDDKFEVDVAPFPLLAN